MVGSVAESGRNFKTKLDPVAGTRHTCPVASGYLFA
jgi:hypothetical protein